MFFHRSEVLVTQSCRTLWPQGLQPTRLLFPWDFPGKDTGVGCHFLLQGIFLTEESNLGLLHCRQTVYWLSYDRSLSQSFSQFLVVLGGPLSNVHAQMYQLKITMFQLHSLLASQICSLRIYEVETVLFSQKSSLTPSLSVIFGAAPSIHPFLSLLLLSSHLPRSI